MTQLAQESIWSLLMVKQLQFKRNSLAVYASIRAVSARENPETIDPTSSTRRSTPSKVEPKFDMVVGEHEMLAIQTVIKPHDELLGRTFRRGWKLTSSGNPVIIMPASKSYLDPGISYSRKDWPFRSTAFQNGDFSWELAEFCNQYYHSEDTEDADVMGTIGQQELVEIDGAQLDANAYTFPEQPEIAMEIMEGHNPEEFNPILNLVKVGMFLAGS